MTSSYSSREGYSPREPSQLFSKMHGLGNDFIVVPLPPIAENDLVCFDPNELNTAVKVNCSKRFRDVDEEEVAGVFLNNSSTTGNETDPSLSLSPVPTHAEDGKYHPMLRSFMENNGRRIRCLSSRKRGIGCDQFIVYSGALISNGYEGQQCDNGQSQRANATPRPSHKKGSNLTDIVDDASIPPAVFMWIFNGASGEEVGMCGNAVRCVVKHFVLEYEQCLDHWGLGEKKSILLKTAAANTGASEILTQQRRATTHVPHLYFSDTYFKKVVQRIISCDIADYRTFSEEGCAMLGMALSASSSSGTNENGRGGVTTSTSGAADKDHNLCMYEGPLASYKVSVLVPKAGRHLSCIMEIDPMKASDVPKKELAHTRTCITSAGCQTTTNSASQSPVGQALVGQSEAALAAYYTYLAAATAAAGITPTDRLIQQHIFGEFVTPSCVERSLMPFQQHTHSPSGLTRELAERAIHKVLARPLLARLSAYSAVAAGASSAAEGEDEKDDATLNLAAASPIVRVNMGPVKKDMLQILHSHNRFHYQPSHQHLLKESHSSLPFPPNLSDIFGGSSVHFLEFLVQRMKFIENLAHSIRIDETCGQKDESPTRNISGHSDGAESNISRQKDRSVMSMLRNLFFSDQVFIGRVRELCSRFGANVGNSSSLSSGTANTLLLESFGKLVANVRGRIEEEILAATPTTFASAESSKCTAHGGGRMKDDIHTKCSESRVPLVSVCDVGNPHCVFLFNHQQAFARDLLAVDDLFVSIVGLVVERGLPEIFPQGVNVEFAFRMEEELTPDPPTLTSALMDCTSSVVRMRVWERGEGITEACGSGACAVGVANHVLSLPVEKGEKETTVAGRCKMCFESRTRVILDGGMLLIDTFQESCGESSCGLTISSVVMAGDASLVASGSLAF